MRDHQKLTSNLSPKGLICQHPPALRGQQFMELEPPAFCAVPVVLKLAIQDIQPYSIFVSWKGRNHTGLHGYRVAYYPIEDPDYPAAAISSVAITPNVSNNTGNDCVPVSQDFETLIVIFRTPGEKIS